MPLKILQNPKAEVTHTLAIAAGKGGVGKSTFTVLLAAALRRMGDKVGILDADLYGPSIRSMVPEEHPPKQVENRLIPARGRGMKMLSMAFFQDQSSIRAPLANQMMIHFLKKTAWGPLDWLLIDFPPGRGDIPLTATQHSMISGALMVTTPQKTAALEVLQAARLFRKMGIPILGIVENMSYFETVSCTPFGAGAAEALAHKIGAPCLGQIPIDPELSEKADRGTLADMELKVVNQIAERLKKGWLERFTPFCSLVNSRLLKMQWKEGKTVQLDPRTLQQHCPCVRCQKQRKVQEDVVFKDFEHVGRYALRFQFSSGCSDGIYPFDWLKQIHS